MAQKRTRNWATILYPSSSNKDWKLILENLHIDTIISPLHSKDLDTNGEFLKEHHHLLFVFPGNKSIAQIKEITNAINSVGCEPVANLRSYARYLVHLDHPDKYQYDVNSVETIGSLNYKALISLPQDKYSILGEIIDYCIENLIYSYAELLVYAKNNNYTWFQTLCDSPVPIINFLKSYHWTNTQKNNLQKGENSNETQ